MTADEDRTRRTRWKLRAAAAGGTVVIAAGALGAGEAAPAGSTPANGPSAAGLDPTVAPGGNIDLSVWADRVLVGTRSRRRHSFARSSP